MKHFTKLAAAALAASMILATVRLLIKMGGI